MDKNISKILQDIANTAASAADTAKAAVMTAKDVVVEKYDVVKMNREMTRLRAEQEDVFSDIGRMLFLMHTGKVGESVQSDEGEKSPQQVIDALLVEAEQLQQQMDALSEKLEDLDEGQGCKCPQCGHLCAKEDVFCAACGAKLSPEPDALQKDAPYAGEGQNGPDA